MAIAIKLTVLIPCYNEEEGLKGVIDEINKVLSDFPAAYEILVVDDCSTDRSKEIAQSCGVRVISHPQRLGSGAARKNGINQSRGEIIATLDADASYDPSELPRMLKMMDSYDQVNGLRKCEQGDLKPLRTLVKNMVKSIVRLICGATIPDLNTGFKVFRKADMLPYLNEIPDGFSCVTTMTMLYLAHGKRLKYHPVNYRPRKGRAKFRPLADGWTFFQTAVKTAFLVRKTNRDPW